MKKDQKVHMQRRRRLKKEQTAHMQKKVQKKPAVAAQNVCMCGRLKVHRIGKKTVALCSALTGTSNFLPSMLVSSGGWLDGETTSAS